jgi:hypothetical protein
MKECSPDALDPDSDLETLLGGYYYLIEDTRKDFLKMMDMSGCADLQSMMETRGLDLALCLGSPVALAVVGRCASNTGGPVFVIRKTLLDKYPSIHWHMEQASMWTTEGKKCEKYSM